MIFCVLITAGALGGPKRKIGSKCGQDHPRRSRQQTRTPADSQKQPKNEVAAVPCAKMSVNRYRGRRPPAPSHITMSRSCHKAAT